MFFPAVTLRVKLFLVSLLVLVIPIMGYRYSMNLEAFLLEAQKEALQLTAKAVTTILNDRPDLFKRNLLQSLDARKEHYAFPLNEKNILLDGKSGDWGTHILEIKEYGKDNLLTNNANYVPGLSKFKHLLGKKGGYYYALFVVTDDKVIYRGKQSNRLDKSDYLEIALDTPEGNLLRYLLTAFQDGWVNAFLMSTDRANFVPVENETRIQGVWSKTDEGYNIEIMIPSVLVHQKIAFAIGDVDDPVNREVISVIGTSDTSEVSDLGIIMERSLEIENILKGLDKPSARIWVIDKKKRARAVQGKLISDKADIEHIPSLPYISYFLRPLYRLFTVPFKESPTPEPEYLSAPDFTAKEFAEIEKALKGFSVSSKRHTKDAETGILFAAEPLMVGEDVMGCVVVEQTISSIVAVKNRVIENTIDITVLVFVIGALFLFVFASRLSGRIRKLSKQATEAIGSDGSVKNTIITVDSRDEIGDLSKKLSSMLQRLQEYNQFQEKMADNLEHELRTPLASINAALINLKNSVVKDENTQHYLHGAQSSLKKMETILGSIREATSLEEALRNGQKEEFNLTEALEYWVNETYKNVFPKQEFILDAPKDSISIWGDPIRISQLVDKIVENAVDFSYPDKPVILSLRSLGDKVEVSVKNEGPMLPESMKEQIFNSLVSLREGQEEKPHLGLGLYIARLITDFHGGNIKAESRENGVSGAIFRVVLPCCSEVK